MKLLKCVFVVLLTRCVLSLEDRNTPENFTELDDEFFREAPRENLDNNQVSLIAFSTARSKPLKGHRQKQFAVDYDHVFLNRGGYFNAETGTFTVPTQGVYEFIFSGGALPHRKLSLQLMKNHFEVQTLAFDGHRKKNPHVQNQKILLELESGDRIWIRLAASRVYGVVGKTGHGYVTTFTGRLLTSSETQRATVDGISLRAPYDQLPDGISLRSRAKRKTQTKRSINGVEKRKPVAFSVARTSCVMGQSSNRSRVYSIKNGAITFDKTFVNVDETLDLGTGEFTAPVSGLYFFSFTVGKYPKRKLSVSLIKNENEFQVMVYDESPSDRRQMQSQSLILDLKGGDKIWLKSYDSPGYAVYSNLGNYITFNGYLLHAS